MKKIGIAFLMVALCAVSVFAIDLSAGGNLDFTHQWSSTKVDSDRTVSSYNLIGVNAFFDAQYVRAGLGMNFTVGGLTEKDKDGSETDKKASGSQFNLSVLGKYPFDLGFAKVYPLVGFQFTFNTSLKYDGEDVKKDYDADNKKDLNHYYFVAGAGMDFGITENLYVTPTMLFGVDMKKPSNYKDNKDTYDKANKKYRANNFMFNVGVGVGYKF